MHKKMIKLNNCQETRILKKIQEAIQVYNGKLMYIPKNKSNWTIQTNHITNKKYHLNKKSLKQEIT